MPNGPIFTIIMAVITSLVGAGSMILAYLYRSGRANDVARQRSDNANVLATLDRMEKNLTAQIQNNKEGFEKDVEHINSQLRNVHKIPSIETRIDSNEKNIEKMDRTLERTVELLHERSA